MVDNTQSTACIIIALLKLILLLGYNLHVKNVAHGPIALNTCCSNVLKPVD